MKSFYHGYPREVICLFLNRQQCRIFNTELTSADTKEVKLVFFELTGAMISWADKEIDG